MEDPEAALRTRIVQHMNAWSDTCGMSFTETSGTGNVRISLGAGGYWSYLGSDVKLIPEDQQTMNLEGFSMDTPESNSTGSFATRPATRSVSRMSTCATSS